MLYCKRTASVPAWKVLKQLGMYVMCIANGDVTALGSSGYTLSKIPSPNYITNPGNVSLSNGITAGVVQSSVPAVKGGKSYLHQIYAEPATSNAATFSIDAVEDSQWITYTSSKSRYTFTDLQPGVRYWVRAAVIGSKNQIAYGPASAIYAQ